MIKNHKYITILLSILLYSVWIEKIYSNAEGCTDSTIGCQTGDAPRGGPGNPLWDDGSCCIAQNSSPGDGCGSTYDNDNISCGILMRESNGWPCYLREGRCGTASTAPCER